MHFFNKKEVSVKRVLFCICAVFLMIQNMSIHTAKGFNPDEELYVAGDTTYVFGKHGEGLMRVIRNNEVIYNFGNRPAWFMLKYMRQILDENDIVWTKARYLSRPPVFDLKILVPIPR
jgi:hypothetical protein